MIAEEADDAAALSITERQTQSAQISGDLLAAERDLSWFVWSGLSQGFTVWFGDVRPAAILGAQLVTIPPGNGGGSSPSMTPTTSSEGAGDDPAPLGWHEMRDRS